MRNVNYFPRYHGKENFHTANAMLLLSKLYEYSSVKFYEFLSQFFEDENEVNLGLQIGLQESTKNGVSVTDASIRQESFKIAIETKRNAKSFDIDQLKRHLSTFEDEKYKLLITLSPDKITDAQQKEITEICQNEVCHVHLNFAELIENIKSVIDEHDYTFTDIINDYASYCDEQGLITRMPYQVDMRLTGGSFDSNKKYNLYYNGANKGFANYAYIGLYKNKSMRAIGKLSKRCIAEVIDKSKTNFDINNLEISPEIGTITDDDKKRIVGAILESPYKDSLINRPHRYFLVEQFYDTDFAKNTKRPPLGNRIFDLGDVLGLEDNEFSQKNTEEIAELLKREKWQ